jgi:hypothetical protein
MKDLIQATLRLYTESAAQAWRAFLGSWQLLFAQAVVLCGVSTAFALSRNLNPFFNEFLGGLLLAIFLSHYFTTVLAAISHEKLSFRESFLRIQSIFPRMLMSLFYLFLLSFIVHIFLMGRAQPEWRVVFNLLITLGLNALFETTSQSESVGIETFRETLAFIGENFWEWFLAYLALVILILLCLGAQTSVRPVLALLALHPVQILQACIATLGNIPLILRFPLLPLLGLPLMYLFFLFRGILYRSLARSNRRKRIFDERFR